MLAAGGEQQDHHQQHGGDKRARSLLAKEHRSFLSRLAAPQKQKGGPRDIRDLAVAVGHAHKKTRGQTPRQARL